MAERAGARRAGLVADVHDSVEVEEEASNPSASLTTAEAYPPGCGRAHQAEHWPEQPPALPAARRYEYFIKRSASHGELWDFTATADGSWPRMTTQYTLPCLGRIRDSRRRARPGRGRAKTLRRSMSTSGSRAGFHSSKGRDSGSRSFQTTQDQGIGVSPERLKRDLEEELSLFEL